MPWTVKKFTSAKCRGRIARAWLSVDGRPQGSADPSGRIKSCYLHDIFTSDTFRAAFLKGFDTRSDLAFDAQLETTLDALAAHREEHLNIDMVGELAEKPSV